MSMTRIATDSIYRTQAITKSDSTLLDIDAVFIGTAGNIAIKFEGDTSAQTFLNMANASTIKGKIRYVMATDTTAANMIGLVYEK